jgi:hypothetical protein
MPGTPQPRCRERHPACRNLPVKVAGYTFLFENPAGFTCGGVFVCEATADGRNDK